MKQNLVSHDAQIICLNGCELMTLYRDGCACFRCSHVGAREANAVLLALLADRVQRGTLNPAGTVDEIMHSLEMELREPEEDHPF